MGFSYANDHFSGDNDLVKLVKARMTSLLIEAATDHISFRHPVSKEPIKVRVGHTVKNLKTGKSETIKQIIPNAMSIATDREYHHVGDYGKDWTSQENDFGNEKEDKEFKEEAKPIAESTNLIQEASSTFNHPVHGTPVTVKVGDTIHSDEKTSEGTVEKKVPRTVKSVIGDTVMSSHPKYGVKLHHAFSYGSQWRKHDDYPKDADAHLQAAEKEKIRGIEAEDEKHKHELHKEEASAGKFGVYRKGGSIGGNKSLETYHPTHGLLSSSHDTESDAQDTAKRMNKMLSPGEKSYYKMKYHVKPISNTIKEEHSPSSEDAEIWSGIANTASKEAEKTDKESPAGISKMQMHLHAAKMHAKAAKLHYGAAGTHITSEGVAHTEAGNAHMEKVKEHRRSAGDTNLDELPQMYRESAETILESHSYPLAKIRADAASHEANEYTKLTKNLNPTDSSYVRLHKTAYRAHKVARELHDKAADLGEFDDHHVSAKEHDEQEQRHYHACAAVGKHIAESAPSSSAVWAMYAKRTKSN